ncbi:MAG TPA: endoflagellar protein [Clostridiales bacterium]|nr:endoflagellar protein [Clostridiales bacterium]
MIELTKLNQEKFYMNCDHIETIEQMPDTLITMMNGRKYYALESAEEVIKKITEYKKTLYANCSLMNKRKTKSAPAKEDILDN